MHQLAAWGMLVGSEREKRMRQEEDGEGKRNQGATEEQQGGNLWRQPEGTDGEGEGEGVYA